MSKDKKINKKELLVKRRGETYDKGDKKSITRVGM